MPFFREEAEAFTGRVTTVKPDNSDNGAGAVLRQLGRNQIARFQMEDLSGPALKRAAHQQHLAARIDGR